MSSFILEAKEKEMKEKEEDLSTLSRRVILMEDEVSREKIAEHFSNKQGEISWILSRLVILMEDDVSREKCSKFAQLTGENFFSDY